MASSFLFKIFKDIGDSFSEKYFGYFSKHAKNTINFRTVYSFLPEIYIDNSPDLVIQEVLNMYLLEKPPLNPEGIRGARVKALAGKEENTTVIVRKTNFLSDAGNDIQ